MEKSHDYIQLLSELQSITMKRNTAMTIIESSDILKTITYIKKQIQCIKHQSKRSQLLQVYNVLDSNIMTHLKSGGKKIGIWCIGQLMDTTIYYKYINVNPPISSYDYDDIFNVFKITQILYNIQPASESEILNLISRFNTKYTSKEKSISDEYKSRYFIGNEIDENIDQIKTLYHITKSINSSPIPIIWLSKNKQIKLILDYTFDPSCPASMCNAIGI
jgi:hypothetical protein